MNIDIFRAYDIRGVYPTEINEETAYTIGKGYGSYLQEKYQTSKCIVSHDNRLSSDSLTANLIKGITESGCNVINLGLTTTPMNYFAREYYQLPGIMVTASHNPKDDNGFKFSFDGMINARGEMIIDFKNYVLNGNFKTGLGKVEDFNIKNDYLNYLYSTVSIGNNKRKIVFDPGNGVVSTIIKEVFNFPEIEAIYINDESDGSFPNHHPDPSVKENMQMLSQTVIENHADFGIGYDGDGDRIGIVMNNGQMLPIEYFMIIIIGSMLDQVDNKRFLYDIKCSKSIEDYLKSVGAQGVCYRTGASYTEYKVYEDKLPFGCEYSGHVYFADRSFDCCSALYASLRFIEIMSNNNLKLSEIVKDFPHYYATEEIKIKTRDETKFNVIESIKQEISPMGYNINDIDGMRITFEDGWVLIRASNTGPNITFRVEATSEEKLQEYQTKYLALIEKYNQ